MEPDVILVVDDEPAILETYRDYLLPARPAATRVRTSRLAAGGSRARNAGSPGFRILLAHSGEEAVELVRAEMDAGGHVTCGFFDMRMPGGMDGLETIRAVRALDPRILVAIVTAYQDRSLDDIAPLFAGGHEDEWDYLNKPFTEPEIAQKARNLVASWHRRRLEERYLAELEEQVEERTRELSRKAKELEEALADLQRTQSQLVHKERLAAVGQLCAGLAHEINTPASYALHDLRHLLVRGVVTHPADQDVLQTAVDGVQRIAEISRELRLFALDDRGEHEDVDINMIVDRALRVANRPLHAQGDVVVRRGIVPLVRGDAGQLAQIVVTLLLHTSHALDIKRRSENVIVVTTEARGPDAVIRIADNGAGMAKDRVERVFEPFFAQRSAGSGLGLSVARRLVERHNGSIIATSEPGRGTSFEVVLPGAPPHEVELPTSAAPGSGPRLRLLIIDDDPILLAMYRRWLGDYYDLETAEGAAAGFEALERDERYDAILCDVMMPDVSGIDFFHTLRGRRPDLAERLIFVTGGIFTEEAQSGLEDAGRPCLFKPFEIEELVECLDELRRPWSEGAVPEAAW